MTFRQTLASLALIGLGVAAAIAIIFQDNITRFNLNPQVPYQLSTTPPPPAYGARGAWVLWPDEADAATADVFYIHSTTFASSSHWNGPINAEKADRVLRQIAVPNEAGPFLRMGAVYGPRYRQATLFASFTHKYDGTAARRLAYTDIEKAFEVFLNHRREDRPIVLAGYGQGGLYVLGLLQHYFAKDETLYRQLAAAYIIGEPVPMSAFDGPLENISACETPEDIRCVISYVDVEEDFETEKSRLRKRALLWMDDRSLQSVTGANHLCVNPLSWAKNDQFAGPDTHLGAASATGLGLGEKPPAISKAITARCLNGLLEVSKPDQSFLRRRHWFGDHWRPQDFNLFYHDLTEDALRRAHITQAVMIEESRFLAPIDDAVDLTPSPVNKVPD